MVKLKKIFSDPIFSVGLNNIIQIISSLIAIPIVISNLTVEEINIWFLLMTLVALSQSVLFGFNGTFLRFISYSYSGIKIDDFSKISSKKKPTKDNDCDTAEFSSIYSLMKKIYLLITIIYSFIISIIGYFVLKDLIFDLKDSVQGWFSFLAVILGTSTTIYLGFNQIFIEGINKVNLSHKILAANNFIGFFIIIWVLIYMPSLFSIILVYQVVPIIGLLILLYNSLKFVKKLKLSPKPFNKKLFGIVWDSAWKSGFTVILANIVKNISGILVSQLFTPAISASFLFTKKIFETIDRVTLIPFIARIPKIASIRSKGDIEVFSNFTKQTFNYSYLIFIFSYLIFITQGEFILSLIKSNVNLGSKTLIILFSFSTLISRWSGIILLISNLSHLILEHISSVIVAIVYFISLYLGYKYFSIEIFPIAHTIGVIISAFFIFKKFYSSFDESFFSYEKTKIIFFTTLLILINTIYFIFQ